MYFKRLIARRQYAFLSGQNTLFRSLRNRVNRVRKSLQTQFYLEQVNSLKTSNPAKWWKAMKSICRFKNSKNDSFDGIKYQDSVVPSNDLPTVLNKFFASVTNDIPVLNPVAFHLIAISYLTFCLTVLLFQY